MDHHKVTKIRDKAEKLYSKGKFKDARERYYSIMEEGETDPKIYIRIGDISRKLQDRNGAVDLYKKASEVYARRGMIVKAIAVCKMILNVDPSRGDIEENLATLYSNHMGRPEKPDLFKATEPEPSTPAEPSPPPEVVPEVVKDPEPVKESEAKVENAPLPVMDASPSHKEELEVDVKAQEDPFQSEVPFELLADIEIEGSEPSTEGISRPRPNSGGNLLFTPHDPLADSDGLELTPLFSEMTRDELAVFIKKLKIRSFKMGEFVFTHGEEGHSIYVITSGAAEEVSHTKYAEEVQCATLMDGDFFGEYSYFSGQPRNSDVRALTTLELLEVDKDEMVSVAKEHPKVMRKLFDFNKERVLGRLLAVSKFFKHISAADRAELAKRLWVERYPVESNVVEEGDPADAMFLILGGQAEIWKADRNGNKQSIIKLAEGDYFGEVAMTLTDERVANVTSITDLQVAGFSKQLLGEIFSKHPVTKKIIEGVARKHMKDSRDNFQ